MDTVTQTIGFRLAMVCRAHRNRAAEALAPIGLYVGQEWILLRLREQADMTPTELAAACGVEVPTISKGLQRMEKAGLVTRRYDDTDARVSRGSLTARGMAACAAVEQAWADLEDRAFAGLSDDELVVLRRALDLVERNLA